MAVLATTFLKVDVQSVVSNATYKALFQKSYIRAAAKASGGVLRESDFVLTSFKAGSLVVLSELGPRVNTQILKAAEQRLNANGQLEFGVDGSKGNRKVNGKLGYRGEPSKIGWAKSTSSSPTASPTTSPTSSPTLSPTTIPTASPSTSPTTSPTMSPTESPSTRNWGKHSASSSLDLAGEE